MKKILFFGLAAGLFACNSPEGEKAEVSEQQTVAEAEGTFYSIDSTSTVKWMGSKPTGSHTGTFSISEGILAVKENNLTGGNFLININSLKNEDLAAGDGKEKLEGHLKSADFFDGEKFPTAKFEITGIEPYTADSSSSMKDATHLVKGNLTLKDSTKNISFPARVKIDSATINAYADFNIDRTMWGMNYKGPKNPQDWVISKQVNLKINLTGSKK